MPLRKSLHTLATELHEQIAQAGVFWLERIPADLGNHAGTVRVPGTENMVYARVPNGQVVEVFNSVAPEIYGWKVYIGRDKANPGLLKVIEVRWVWNIANTIAYVLFHHKQHEYPAPDTVWVRRDQFLPLLVLPAGGFSVRVFGDIIYETGMLFPIRVDDQDLDLTAYIPGSGALYALLEADSEGNINVVTGENYIDLNVLRAHPLPVPTTGAFPICGIELYDGQTEIRRDSEERNIIDLRMFTSNAADASSGGGASALADLTDVDVSAVVDLDTLIYDAASSTWLTGAPTPGASALDDLTDVDTTGVADRDALIYDADSSTWIPGLVRQGGDIVIYIPGVLSAVTDIHPSVLVIRDSIIEAVYIYAKTLGSAGDTIVDVNKNGSTIFTTTGNRPTLNYADANGWAVSGLPDVGGAAEGDVLTVDLDSIATGAADLTIVIKIASEAPVPETPALRMFTWAMESAIYVRTGTARMYNNFGANFAITKVFIAANTAPTGNSIKVDIHKNGTTIFTNQAHRPTMAAGTNTGVTTDIDVSAFNDGDYLTMDVDQIGSTLSGSDLIVNLFFQ